MASTLGNTDPGTTGEGELLPTHGLFRSGSLPVSSSAFYARRFPETPASWTLEFLRDDISDYNLITFIISVPEYDADKQIILSTGADTDAAYSTGEFYSRVGLSHLSSSGGIGSAADVATHFKNRFNELFCVGSASAVPAHYGEAIRGAYSADLISPTKVRVKFHGSYEAAAHGVGVLPRHGSRPIASDDLAFYFTKHSAYEGDDSIVNFKVEDTTYLAGAAEFQAAQQSGRDPFAYDSYDDFILQPRLMAKDYSVIPEYRISELIPTFLESNNPDDPYFSCPDNTYLTLTGALDDFANSGQPDFFKVLCHSDFVRYFDIVQEDLEETNLLPSVLTLKCKAAKKFLPYDGFYPAQRMLQLATKFSQSFGVPEKGHFRPLPEQSDEKSQSYMGSWQTMLKPFYAPGIAFNTIKAGLAVDYPILSRQVIGILIGFVQSLKRVTIIGWKLEMVPNGRSG